MRIDNFNDFDDFDDFVFEKSHSLGKLLDEFRRDERKGNYDHHPENIRDRRHQVDWDWGDYEEWD